MALHPKLKITPKFPPNGGPILPSVNNPGRKIFPGMKETFCPTHPGTLGINLDLLPTLSAHQIGPN